MHRRREHREPRRHTNAFEAGEKRQERVRVKEARKSRRGGRWSQCQRPHDHGGCAVEHKDRSRTGLSARRRVCLRSRGDRESRKTGHRQQDWHQAGKEELLGRQRRRRRPDGQHPRRIEEGLRLGTEEGHFARCSDQAEAALHGRVLNKEREKRQRGQRPGANEHPPARWRSAPVHEPGKPQDDEHREEQEVVAVRERLHEPGTGKQRQPSTIAGLKKPMHGQEAQRHPLGGQDLQVRELPGAIWAEPVGQGGRPRGDIAHGCAAATVESAVERAKM